MARRNALGVLDVGGVFLLPIGALEMLALTRQTVVVVGGVSVTKVDLLGDQVAVIPVDDRARDVGLAVQRRIVRQNDHAILGDADVCPQVTVNFTSDNTGIFKKDNKLKIE